MNDLLRYKLNKRAAKELKKIRQSDGTLFTKIVSAIDSIRENPLVGEAKKGDLKGYYCLDVIHRGTNYEICYTMEEDENGELILVVLMGPRENFYVDLKRYLGL
jgi:mRNA interferase RelE/StbE